MPETYDPPSDDPNVNAFTCGHCRVLAQQSYGSLSGAPAVHPNALSARQCQACQELHLFLGGQLIYPLTSPAPPPNPDLPEEVRRDYVEAANIVVRSPRGAAALLRLAIQKLLVGLGQAENLNDAIGALVARNALPGMVHQALDVVRVVGNNAVHPGELDLEDNQETAMALFSLVNLVADYGLTKPSEVKALYDSLPAGAREAIERRSRS